MDIKHVIRLLSQAKEQGVILFLEGQKLRYRVQGQSKIDPQFMAQIKSHKLEITRFLQDSQAEASKHADRIPSIVLAGITSFPASFAQERLWFVDQLEDSSHYHTASVWSVKGPLNTGALEYAFNALIDRQQVLRTVLREINGQMQQFILPANTWKLRQRIVQPGASTEEVDLLIQKEVNVSFDLSQDHPLRALLLKCDTDGHLLILTLHHIASDGWSMSLLVDELAEFYLAQTEHRKAMLAELPIQYVDYAHWQRNTISTTVLQQQMRYWETQLKEVTPLNLYTDMERPKIKSNRGRTETIWIEEEIAQALNQLAQEKKATLFMVLLAGLKVLLFKYTGQRDICIGSPIANRTRFEVESLIGCFVNTLALRTKITEEQSFSDLLGQVKATTLNAYAHQDVPFEKVVEKVIKTRDRSRNPLSEVVFVLQNTPESKVRQLNELCFEPVPFQQDTASYDLHISAIENKDGISISFNYCADLFYRNSMINMLRHFRQLLIAILAGPNADLSDLSVMSAAEKEQVLVGFNQTAAAFPKHKTLVHLFAERVEKCPDAPAVTDQHTSISYRTLAERSDRLAVLLQESYGIEPGDAVGVVMSRSVWAIVALIGILKARAVYVPIDPSFPEKRQQYMIEDAGIKTIIIHSESLMDMSGFEKPLLSVDLQLEERTQEDGPPAIQCQAEDTAYVIYTSGSTGHPKGVMISNSGITNTILAQIPVFDLHPGDRALQFASLSFDASISEIFTALIAGAELNIMDEKTKKDLTLFTYFMQKRSIQVATLPPSFLRQVAIEDLSGLDTLITAGEAAPYEKAKAFLAYGNYCNAYGPTEMSICAAMKKYPKGTTIERSNVPIGQPIANTKIYILDTCGHPVPIGVGGELYLGGAGLAEGYVNLPELTDKSFVNNPFATPGNEKLYRTGDFARWLADGSIQFLGRRDQFVKWRAYRIELGEIDAVLNRSDLVKQAVSVLKSGSDEDPKLVTYYQPAGLTTSKEIRAYLKDYLPEYMLPSHLVEVDQFPVNQSGKIDRAKLPHPENDQAIQQTYVAAGNALEQQLLEIWQNLLGLEQIGVKDNFFEIGGHSLLLIRLANLLEGSFSISIPITVLFDLGNIAALARYIELSRRNHKERARDRVEYEL
jgi:amino acid adenylation domain-containing protein